MKTIFAAARSACAASFFLLVPFYAAHAESILGTVTDPAGQPITAARVAAWSGVGLIAEQSTDSAGHFELNIPNREQLRLIVTAPGFETKALAPGAAKLSIQLSLAAQNDSILVTGSTIDVPASEQGTSVNVVTRQQIRSRNEGQAFDLLRYLPGVVVTQGGQRGALAGISIRGGETKFNLVQINGVSVDSFYYGGFFDVAHIPSDFLDRIEVARGPQSAIYGSYATSGVVNFVTRAPEEGLHLDLLAEGGSYGERRFAVSGSGTVRGLGLAASASRLDSEGPVRNSDYHNRNLFLSAGRKWSRQSLFAAGNFNSNETGAPGAYGSNPAHLFAGIDLVSRSRNYFSNYLAHYVADITDRVREDISGGFFLNNSPYLSPYGLSRNKDLRGQADARTIISITPNYTASVGFAVSREQVKNTYITDVSGREFLLRRDTEGLYWENRIQLGRRLFLNAGLRAEFFQTPAIPGDAYGSRPPLPGNNYVSVNPKLAAAYLVRSTRFHASFGKGIRPPGAGDLAFTNNPALRPEKTISVDAGVEQRLLRDRLTVGATYFLNNFSDQIVGLGGSLSVLGSFRTGNLSRTRTRGGEFTAELRPARWISVSGSYTYLDSRILSLQGSDVLVPKYYTSGMQLPRRPKHSGTLVSTFQWRQVSANVVGYFRGDVLDIEPNFGASAGFYRNPGFQNLGVNLNYRLPHGVTVYGNLRNALNQRYEEIFGFPSPALNFVSGVKWSFSRSAR